MKLCTYLSTINDFHFQPLLQLIQREHPLLILLPTLPFLQKKIQALSISWFQRDNETSTHLLQLLKKETTDWINTFINNCQEKQETEKKLSIHLKNIEKWTANNTELELDKYIQAEISYLSCELLTSYLHEQHLPAEALTKRPLIHLNMERKIDLEESRQALMKNVSEISSSNILISPLSLCQNVEEKPDFYSSKHYNTYAEILSKLLEKKPLKTKKWLLITSNQSLVNLKSNTYEKNTLQRYMLLPNMQI